MDNDHSPTPVNTPAGAGPSANSRGPAQAVTGLTPPQLGEALIREAWPTVLAFQPGLARLAHRLMKTVVLAPLGWLLLAPLFAFRFRPFFCKRYTLTNRRLMIQAGIKPSPVQEIALADIDAVRLDPASFDEFFLSGTLEVLSKGQVALRLVGVPEPDSFRHAVVNAWRAWAPDKAKGPFVPASATK
jgi:hypothetical protein